MKPEMQDWRHVWCLLAIASLVLQTAHAACPALTVNFFPEDTTNVPAAWTRAAQAAAGNEDSSSLNTVTLTAKPAPKLYIQPVHPLFSKRTCVPEDCLPGTGSGRRKLSEALSSASVVLDAAANLLHIDLNRDLSVDAAALVASGRDSSSSSSSSSSRQLQQASCLTTVMVPAAYDIQYNIDGGVNKKATMPSNSPPFISLTMLDTLAPGKHTLNVIITMLKETAEVNSVKTLQPPTDQQITSKVVFNLVDKLPAGASEATAVNGAAAEGDNTVAAAEGEGPSSKNATEVLADNPQPNPAIDAVVTQQAVKYYCMRQYNVAGKILEQVEVPAGDEGVMSCGVACNAEGADCAGFGLTGRKCFLIRQFDGNNSKADGALDALCMKSPSDWLDFGNKNALLVGSGFFCLRGYDLKGDPAGSGDPENPAPASNTELVGMTPSLCATACKSTLGCQYIVMKKPAVAGATATCYLKMHALGGLYGTTGPASDVDLTCFNGQDAWMTFGGQLDYALPSPEVNTGVATPAITPIGVNVSAASKSYYCIKQYSIQGSIITRHNVSMGDEGLTQCAGKCNDLADGTCIAFSMLDAGQCSLFSAVKFNTSASDANTYGLCFSSSADWNKFGQPDDDDMYCLKKYDFAGDNVRHVDYITITAGSAAVQFCKQQCIAEPMCQYVVTSKGLCYMKNNILSGNFGSTRVDNAVDATCVKGQQNWAAAALQVAANPLGAGVARPVGTTRRRESTTSSAQWRHPSYVYMFFSSCASLLLHWLFSNL